MEQKKLKEVKDKQKRIVTNEMKRKYSYDGEGRDARFKGGGDRRKKGGFSLNPHESTADPIEVMKMIEKKHQLMKQHKLIPPVDIEIVLKHDADQSR